MSELIDLTNHSFGLLTVQSRGPNGPNGEPRWSCLCACGNTTLAYGVNLRHDRTTSCGCFGQTRGKLNRTHGMRRTTEYTIWMNLRARCLNPKNPSFMDYGGRGITFLWTSFEEFYRDMGPRPSLQHSIERKDNDGPYSKDNCIWAPMGVQQRNKRSTRLITLFNRTQCLEDWCIELGIAPQVVCCRMRPRKGKRQWTWEEALLTPVEKRRNHIQS